MPLPEPDSVDWYLDFFIKGGGWAAFIASIAIFRWLWGWRDREVKAMRDTQVDTIAKYIEVIGQKDKEITIAQETIKDLYKDQAETLGENIKEVTTVLTNTHNSNATVAGLLAKVESKL